MNASTPLRALCVALLLSLAAPALAFDPGAFTWMNASRTMALDAPETAGLQIKNLPVPGQPGQTFHAVLSQYRGLFFLNAYRTGGYVDRVYKSPALKLFTAQELRVCAPEHYPVEISDNWPVTNELEPGLSLTLMGFDCRNTERDFSNHYLLIDSRDPAHPLLAFSRRPELSTLAFTPLQPVDSTTQAQWLQALQTFPRWFQPLWNVPAQNRKVLILPFEPAASDDSAWAAFRSLHGQLLKLQNKAPLLAQVEDFFVDHDFRQIASAQPDYPGLLNDIAYWTSEAGQPLTARPWLEEVLRRDPSRTPAYLNLADLDWALYEKDIKDNWHQGHALERYRQYCGLRLQQGLKVPPRVTQRLGLKTANAQACQAFWPLIEAVDAGDIAKVQQLLAQGISGDVMAEDGRSALLHALVMPDFAIADLLLAHGAQTRGLYKWQPLVSHALDLDRKTNPDLSQAPRLDFLLKAGAAIDEPDHRGRTLLFSMARDRRDLPRLNWLLKHPQNLDRRSDPEGETALYQAVDGGNYAAAKGLIAAGADLNLTYRRSTCYGKPEGYSLLYSLADKTGSSPDTLKDSLELFTLLLEKGADPGIGQNCDKQGINLLRTALERRKREDMLQVLRQHSP